MDFGPEKEHLRTHIREFSSACWKHDDDRANTDDLMWLSTCLNHLHTFQHVLQSGFYEGFVSAAEDLRSFYQKKTPQSLEGSSVLSALSLCLQDVDEISTKATLKHHLQNKPLMNWLSSTKVAPPAPRCDLRYQIKGLSS